MRWRFLRDDPRDAATNMAVDEALYRSALDETALPTVRLYTWSRPSLSVGYRQNVAKACVLDECQRLGVAVVRRISGGRAVLHHHELTYCVTAPAEGAFRGLSVHEVYAWVMGALRATFESLSVAVDPPIDPPTKGRAHREGDERAAALPCFAVPTGHEITTGGKKLVGAAQKWTRRGFLQHGSILLKIDTDLWQATTGLISAEDLGAVGLTDIAGNIADSTVLAAAIEEQFQYLFGEPASELRLTDEEKDLAHQLAERKYANPAWNLHRQKVVLQKIGDMEIQRR